MGYDAKVARHCDFIRARRDGSWSVAHQKDLRKSFVKQLQVLGVFPRPNADKPRAGRLDGDPFDLLFMKVMGNDDAFPDRGCWGLYWSLSEAVHETMLLMRQGVHETVLTGAFLSNIRWAVKLWEDPDQRSNMALHIADHQALWNENKSGADFGLIMETSYGGRSRYVATVIQAKRARTRSVEIDRDQAQKLRSSQVGSYLFYNEFEVLSGGSRMTPTLKSCELVCKNVENKGSVNSVEDANDFALVVAFGMTRGMSAFGLPFETREKAVDFLFNLDRKVQPNHFLVCVVGERYLSAEQVVELEEQWRQLIEASIARRRQLKITAPVAPGRRSRHI